MFLEQDTERSFELLKLLSVDEELGEILLQVLLLHSPKEGRPVLVDEQAVLTPFSKCVTFSLTVPWQESRTDEEEDTEDPAPERMSLEQEWLVSCDPITEALNQTGTGLHGCKGGSSTHSSQSGSPNASLSSHKTSGIGALHIWKNEHHRK